MNQQRDIPQRIFNNQYIIGKKISSGSFGVVFMGIDKIGKEDVAIKVEKEDNEDVKSVEKEFQILRKIQGIQGIPKLHWYGTEVDSTILVLQLLGKDLAFHMKTLKKFSLKTILLLSIQIIHIMQKIHNAGVIHRDLKPENILLGKDADQSTVYLIDFGISKIYRDSDGKHIPFREQKPFIGTTRYASIAAHKGSELSRKDDLESLFYVMIFCIKGHLPWQNMNVPDKDRTKVVGEMKQKYPLDDLCKDLPNEFIKILEYLKTLHFKDEPDYDKIVQLLKKASEENKIQLDNIFDWTDPNSLKKYMTQDSKMSLNKQNSNLDKRLSNQMLWSVNDQQHFNSQNNLLLPPEIAGRMQQRQDSRHPTNQSIQSTPIIFPEYFVKQVVSKDRSVQ